MDVYSDCVSLILLCVWLLFSIFESVRCNLSTTRDREYIFNLHFHACITHANGVAVITGPSEIRRIDPHVPAAIR